MGSTGKRQRTGGEKGWDSSIVGHSVFEVALLPRLQLSVTSNNNSPHVPSGSGGVATFYSSSSLGASSSIRVL